MNPFDMSNNSMFGLLAGVLRFCVAVLSDWVSLKRVPHAKPAITLLGTILQFYAVFAVSFGVERFELPRVVSGLGWFLLPISLSLLAYSLYVEVSFVKTYAQPGARDRLVTTGFYALTRHPGVLWFGLFLVSLLLVTRSSILAIAAPIWFLMDILWVLLQDKYFFVLMFKDYRQYQKETPILIPTRLSILRCLKTLNVGGGK